MGQDPSCPQHTHDGTAFPFSPLRSSPDSLQHMRVLASVVSEARLFRVHETVQASARAAIALNETHERNAATLRIIMLTLSGLLAFAVLDRITGSWSVMDSDWFSDFANPMIKNSPVRKRGGWDAGINASEVGRW